MFKSRTPLILVASLALSGCVTEQPDWLSRQPAGECALTIDEICLSALIATLVSQAAASELVDVSVLRLIAVSSASGIFLSDDLTAKPVSLEAGSFDVLKESYRSAGEAIALAVEGREKDAVDAGMLIADPGAQVFALQIIISLSDGAMDGSALNTALNKLSSMDKAAYVRGLHGRLIGLLGKGDIERANALRDHLLSFYAEQGTSSFAPVTSIAASYAIAGLKEDAVNVFKLAVQKTPDLNTADNMQFITLAMTAAADQYPPPQHFYYLTSDQVRFDAHLLLSAMFRRTGNKALAVLALNDAVRFAQKSSFKLSRLAAVEQVAISSLGVL